MMSLSIQQQKVHFPASTCPARNHRSRNGTEKNVPIFCCYFLSLRSPAQTVEGLPMQALQLPTGLLRTSWRGRHGAFSAQLLCKEPGCIFPAQQIADPYLTSQQGRHFQILKMPHFSPYLCWGFNLKLLLSDKIIPNLSINFL